MFLKVIKVVLIGLFLSLAAHFILGWTYRININEYYQNKRIILTGASRGIGRQLAIQLSQLGARLVIAARTSTKLDQTVAECSSSAHVYPVIADVGKELDCKKIVDVAVEKLGGVDILILNAAFSYPPAWFTQLNGSKEKIFTDVFSVNVLQSVNLVQYGLPYLNESQGNIVAVSSAASQIGMPQVIPYSTSKHGLNGFFKGLRQEFYMTNTPVSITIMPLPYVHTEKALDNWKPIGYSHGISPEDCAQKMLQVIPYRQTWSYIDWSSFIMGRLYSLFPDTFDFCIRQYLPHMSNLF